MIQLTPRETLPTFNQRIGNSFWKGMKFASEGAYWSIPIVALEASTARRGEVLPTLATQAISLSVQPIASGIASAALTATLGLSPAAAALASTVLIGVAASQFEHKLTRGFRMLSESGQQAARVRFGAGYVDTVTAQQRRQRAATELAGALPTSRRWLGQEALFLHR